MNGFNYEVSTERIINLQKDLKFLEGVPEMKISNNLYLSDFKGLRKFIVKEISGILFEKNLIDLEYYYCNLYIASLITETAKKNPESWFAIDYVSKVDSEDSFWPWKEAADTCFLICSLFIKRSNKGLMKFNDYVSMGTSFYLNYSGAAKSEIGYMMSNNFIQMAQITREALKNPFD